MIKTVTQFTAGHKTVAEQLTHLLADSYLLYLKTQNFHWNVQGPHFYPLHKLFEEQYITLANAVDLIAERIRALGYAAPGTFTEFTALSRLQEEAPQSKTPMTAAAMIASLLHDHEILIKSVNDMLPIAEKERDEASTDLLIDRLREHEKIAWMLRSTLVRE